MICWLVRCLLSGCQLHMCPDKMERGEFVSSTKIGPVFVGLVCVGGLSVEME